MQAGTTKDQGLYNKPSAAVHPGALATRTLPQYTTKETEREKVNTKIKTIINKDQVVKRPKKIQLQ